MTSMTVKRRQGRRLPTLEAVWYEASPYIYAAVGLGAVLFSHSDSGLAFSALLLAASLAILRRRRSYRSPESRNHRMYSRPQPSGIANGSAPRGRG